MMHTRMAAADMRQYVLDTFRQLGRDTLTANDIQQRVRIENGSVAAYCYRAADLFAMWMVPVGLVQFYDDQGAMLHTLDLTARAEQHRRAA